MADKQMSYLVQERWHRKLENWALWATSGTVATSSPYPAYRMHLPERAWLNHFDRPPQPLVGEALDVDALLTIMQGEGEIGYKRFVAVRAVYVWTGNLYERAEALHIDPDTLSDRVKAARYRLEDLNEQRKRGAVKAPRNYSMAAD
jgi:hypothetical protein